jgi:quercetin dioxygenase-like cupin family protein
MMAGMTEISNPLSGERITISGAEADGSVLAWELSLAPGGRVPASHSHPRQQEQFTVLAGRVRFRVGWRRLIAGPGDTVEVAAGTVHHFANAGPGTARIAVRTKPALRSRALLETAAALAQAQHAAGRALPNPVEVALFMRDFEAEVAAPIAPGLVRLAARGLAALGGGAGGAARYRRLRRRTAP